MKDRDRWRLRQPWRFLGLGFGQGFLGKRMMGVRAVVVRARIRARRGKMDGIWSCLIV